VLKDFFREWSLSLIDVNLDDPKLDHFKSMRVFIERNGKYINYQTNEENEEMERLRQEEAQAARKQEQEAQRLRAQAALEAEMLTVQREEVRLKMEKLRNDDKAHLQLKSHHLK
jgi:hypothetical protein